MIPLTVTGSTETDVEPDLILEVLMDPCRLPQWAPGFADLVEADANEGWRVTKNDKTFGIHVEIVKASRTVDYLREVAPGIRTGAYIRVLPRPRGGSVVVMTLPIPSGGDAKTTATLLSQELNALVDRSRD